MSGLDASTYLVNNSGGAYSSSLPLPQQGNQYVVMTANYGWSLNQTFTLPTAGTYQFSWYDTLSPSYWYVVSLYQGSNPNPIYSSSFTGASASFGAWVLRSRLADLLAGSYTLQFRTGSGGAALFWDNVSVEAVTVPEPTSMIAGALLLLPFAASSFRISSARRRRRPAGTAAKYRARGGPEGGRPSSVGTTRSARRRTHAAPSR